MVKDNMTELRRKLSRLLAVAAAKINPDPQTTDDYELKKWLADVMGGLIVGRGVSGRPFTPGEDVKRAL